MLNERDWRRRNRDRDEEKKKKKEFWWENGNDSRTKEESTFYTSTIKDGTIKQEKPDKPDIPAIKENIETAEKKVNQLKNEQFDLMAAGGRDDQIYTAKKNVENAQKEVENFNLQLTEAYGLGPNGYWNNKNQMNEQDRIVHEAGQKPTTSVQPATTPTVKPKPITRPKTVTELDNWVNNPEGYRPPTVTATKPKATTPVKPRNKIRTVPTTYLDMDIAQMQDELVNNPNMSEQKKWGIEDKITKLSADRDVLNWRRSRTTTPTVEDFEAKKGYIEQQKQFNQDAIVNGLGNGTLKVGSDEWYALQKKGDKLQEQIDAYNRGMMGVLDGEKAVTAEEQVKNQPGISNANSTVGREQIQPGINNANSTVGREQIQPGINNVNSTVRMEQIHAGINNANSMVGDGGVKDPMEEHMYAIGTGGVTGNYKPPELRELEQAVSSYEVALVNIANETRINDVDKIIIEVLRLKNAGTPLDEKSAWGSAVKKLNELEETTGYTYYEALIKLGREQKNFEEYQRVEEIKAEALERAGELDDFDYSPVDWQNDSVDLVGQRAAQLAYYSSATGDVNDLLSDEEKRAARATFLSEYENIDDDMIKQYTDGEALGRRLMELEVGRAGRKHYEDNYEIAMDGELEDLDGLQLFIRAENDIQNIINEANSEIEAIPGFKQLEQETINLSLANFDKAMQEWTKGDNSAIQSILVQTYGGSKLLNDEDLNFNDFRNKYVKSCWDSVKYEEALIKPILDARDQKLAEYRETMRPYLEEQMNYKEIGDGFKIEITPEIIEYTIAFADEQKSPVIDSEMTDWLGVAAGAAVSAAGGGAVFGALVAILTLIVGNKLDKKGLWEKTADALEPYTDTEKTLSVWVHDDRVNIIKIEDK